MLEQRKPEPPNTHKKKGRQRLQCCSTGKKKKKRSPAIPRGGKTMITAEEHKPDEGKEALGWDGTHSLPQQCATSHPRIVCDTGELSTEALRCQQSGGLRVCTEERHEGMGNRAGHTLPLQTSTTQSKKKGEKDGKENIAMTVTHQRRLEVCWQRPTIGQLSNAKPLEKPCPAPYAVRPSQSKEQGTLKHPHVKKETEERTSGATPGLHPSSMQTHRAQCMHQMQSIQAVQWSSALHMLTRMQQCRSRGTMPGLAPTYQSKHTWVPRFLGVSIWIMPISLSRPSLSPALRIRMGPFFHGFPAGFG
eukprot:RCo016099